MFSKGAYHRRGVWECVDALINRGCAWAWAVPKFFRVAHGRLEDTKYQGCRTNVY